MWFILDSLQWHSVMCYCCLQRTFKFSTLFQSALNMLWLKSSDWLHSFPSTCRIDVLGMDIGKGYWKIYLHVSRKHFDTKCFSHVKSFPPFGWEQYRELDPPSNFECYTKGVVVVQMCIISSSLVFSNGNLENSWETWKLMIGCFYGIGRSIWVEVRWVPKQGVNLENEQGWLIEQHCHQNAESSRFQTYSTYTSQFAFIILIFVRTECACAVVVYLAHNDIESPFLR